MGSRVDIGVDVRLGGAKVSFPKLDRFTLIVTSAASSIEEKLGVIKLFLLNDVS